MTRRVIKHVGFFRDSSSHLKMITGPNSGDSLILLRSKLTFTFCHRVRMDKFEWGVTNACLFLSQVYNGCHVNSKAALCRGTSTTKCEKNTSV